MSNFLLSPKRAVKVSHKSSFHLVLLSTWLTEVFKWLLWVLIRSLWVNILSFRVTLLLTQLWSKHYKATDTRLLVKVSFLRYQNPLLEHRVCYWEKTVFAWKIPWTKEPGRLQSIWSQRVRYNWVTKHTHTHTPDTFHLWVFPPRSGDSHEQLKSQGLLQPLGLPWFSRYVLPSNTHSQSLHCILLSLYTTHYWK